MKNTFKTLIAVLLVVSCLFAACACGPAATKEPDKTPEETPSDVTPSPDEPDNTPEVTPEATPAGVNIPEVVIPTNEAPQFAQPAADANGKVNLTEVLYGTQARSPEKWGTPKANRIFDNDPNTYFEVTEMTSTYIVVYSNAPIKPTTYTMATPADSTAMPKSWKLYGSMYFFMTEDDVISTVTDAGLSTEAGAVSGEYTIEKPGYYQYFKLEITENNGNAEKLQCGDLVLYGVDGDCVGLNIKPDDVDLTKYTVANGLVVKKLTLLDPMHEGEVPSKIFDNDLSTGSMMTLQWAPDTYEWINYEFKMKPDFQIDAYSLVIGNPLSAPVAWKLYGSNDKNLDPESFVLIDERSNENYTVYEGVQLPVYEVQNPGTYMWYIFSVEDTMFKNDENWEWLEIQEFITYKKN